MTRPSRVTATARARVGQRVQVSGYRAAQRGQLASIVICPGPGTSGSIAWLPPAELAKLRDALDRILGGEAAVKKKRALDLFCGAGGVTKGLQRAGYHVVGVDLYAQPRYCGDEFAQGDAITYASTHDLDAFDFLWASPPCQRWSEATRQTGRPEDHPDLIAPVRDLFAASHRPWAIENVPRAPLDRPIILCGAMFDLGVVRHRAFETFPRITQPAHVKHKGSLVTGEYVTVAGNGGVPSWTLRERERRGLPRHREGEYSLANWSRAMGIDWMDRQELVEAIPPAFAEWIARVVEAAWSEALRRACPYPPSDYVGRSEP